MNDISNLLDATLDDIADLPEFKAFPKGVHEVLCTFNIKEINKKEAVELQMVAVSTIELSEPTVDTPLEPNDTTGVLFMLDNEYGAGNFKRIAAIFGEALNTRNIRDIVEQVTDVSCIVMTGLRKDKNDKDKVYTEVKELNVV